jgi:hypothetical protein
MTPVRGRSSKCVTGSPTFCRPVRLLGARLALDRARQLPVPQAIDVQLQLAIRNLRDARSELANPSSLPPSFRN